jgi:hypothetical protein
MRASLYNALPEEGALALAQFMREFAKQHAWLGSGLVLSIYLLLSLFDHLCSWFYYEDTIVTFKHRLG